MAMVTEGRWVDRSAGALVHLLALHLGQGWALKLVPSWGAGTVSVSAATLEVAKVGHLALL